MNVQQLIAVLQELDPELIVVQSGHEGGYREVEDFEEIKLKLNAHPGRRWMGPHEEDDLGDTAAVKLY